MVEQHKLCRCEIGLRLHSQLATPMRDFGPLESLHGDGLEDAISTLDSKKSGRNCSYEALALLGRCAVGLLIPARVTWGLVGSE
jgi:hypothetical protein